MLRFTPIENARHAESYYTVAGGEPDGVINIEGKAMA